MKTVRGTTWTHEEDRVLETYLKRLKPSTIAAKLGKTPSQVERRATYLGITKCTDGYTLLTLSQALGCQQFRIRKWIEKGWLRAEHRNTDRPRDIWYISDAAVLHFLRWHYNEISLAHVNHDWFFDLIFGGQQGIGALEAPKHDTIS